MIFFVPTDAAEGAKGLGGGGGGSKKRFTENKLTWKMKSAVYVSQKADGTF